MVPVADDGSQTGSVPGRLLTSHIGHLKQLIGRANAPGNLDGLLAHYLLHNTRVTFDWNVNPMTEDWLADNSHRLEHAPGLAVLGYGLASFPSSMSPAARDHLAAGLPKLMRRNPFQADGVTFVNDPCQVVGIALGVNAGNDDVPQARVWLADILQDPRLQPPTLLLRVLHEHARQLTGAPTTALVDTRTVDDPADLAGLHWLASAGQNPSSRDVDEVHDLQARILSAVMMGQVGQVSAPRAALLLAATARIVSASVDEIILSRSHIGVVLSRFEDAMRRWRFDGDDLEHPIRWPITSEREVQDILWMILRSVFDDLVDEETLRKIGHSTYRADFGIPSLGVLIEVKYARKSTDFKVFEKEIMEDYVAYLKENGPYRKMAVFIYDESASVQEHGTTRNALLSLEHVTDVIIVSRPSQLPVPNRTRPHPSKRAQGRAAPKVPGRPGDATNSQ